ncbi:MAG: hypothetical protein AVDCRST_MAG64-642 [uncultured Phycisphaerae bacterium]|uniref:Lipopolysaccharide core heptose(I) kinase RfaP n=1 Tax=uncultured Phycisphaerae bacterium TaxID=904963 RepID=A0A6J4N8Z9_9BACT|nr:MAG: hypothetical protein AVDCRST_MAG64-642 [uncultured Phycisphaerae bacterium]
MGLFDPAQDSFRVDPAYQPVVRALGLDARTVFADPRIKVWRKLADRENCTLDVDTGDVDPAAAAAPVRLHVKRYVAVPPGAAAPAAEERDGHQLLVDEQIPTAPLVAWGVLTDRRSFTIWADLAGFAPGDKLVGSGVPFERLLEPTADLAGRLHKAGLHHRDLYLCHFMAKPGPTDADPVEVSLIDTARVRRLPGGLVGLLTRRRWVVKDLAQFWYSTTKLAVTDDQRDRWLARYCQARGDGVRPASLRGAVVRKARAIARHDARLNAKQPARNVSIPQG